MAVPKQADQGDVIPVDVFFLVDVIALNRLARHRTEPVFRNFFPRSVLRENSGQETPKGRIFSCEIIAFAARDRWFAATATACRRAPNSLLEATSKQLAKLA
jgi:hypothetical protein